MGLTREQKIEVILISGERSYRTIAADYNRRHPDREPVSHSTVAHVITKFRETGSVHDRARSGRPRTATKEDTATAVVASFVKSPKRSTRRVALACGISQTSVVRILHTNKWHPYKLQMQHRLNEDDPDRRLEFCLWATEQHELDPAFAKGILFSDEAYFTMNGEVNRHNCRYWSDANPTWVAPIREHSPAKVMVWCGIWDTRIIGPFFIYNTLTAPQYLMLLQDLVFPSILNADGIFPSYFQHDGAPPHYGIGVREWLGEQLPGKWIGRRGPVEWPPRSPDLTPLDFYLWGHLKQIVYAESIRDLRHLEERIQHACDQIAGDTLLHVQSEWLRRLQLCIARDGQHIEHVL